MSRKLALLVGAAVVGAAASPAAAQDAAARGATVSEVVVTAQRLEQNLQQVPVAVTAVGGEELQSRKLNDLNQIQLVAPSFQTTTDNAFSLRGIGSNIFLPTVDSSVGVMVDDVSLGVPLFQSNGVFNDIARIEVLRGPQGLLFGRNASAGLLSVVTNRPRLRETSGALGLEYANRDTADGGDFGAVVRGTLNLPVGENAALRINVLGSHQDPIAKAIVTAPAGSHIDQTQKRVAGRVKYLWEPSDATSLYAVADYSRERGVGGIWDRTLRTLGAGTYAAALNRIGATPGPENLRYGIDSASGNFRSVDTYGVSLSVSHELSPELTLSSITAWRRYDLQLNLDTDYSTNNLFNTNRNGSNNRQFTEELRLAFDFDRIDGQVGLYYFGSVNNGHTQLFANFGSGIPNFFGGDFDSRNTVDSAAAFGQVNFHVTEALTLIAGARVTRDKVKVRIAQDFGTYVNGPGLYGPRGNFRFAESHTDLSYKVGGQYQFTPDVMGYLTYATGYKGPAYPQNLGSTAFNPYIAPETVKAVEGGVRSTVLDGRLRLNVAGFYNKFSDFQTQTYDPVAALFRLANAGGVRSQGVEIDAVARPTEFLTINFGASLIDTEFTDFVTTCYPGQTAAQGCVAGQFQAKGLAPANAPKFTTTLQALYDIPVGANTLTVEGNWFHRSGVNFSPNGDPGTKLGDVDIFGASLTYRFNERYRVSVFCKNCADKHVPSFLSHVTADALAILQSWNFNSVRTIGASLDVEF
ncbi:MAG: TonB-dependent receptor [Phenylobacterium sp.]|uniref:TonB-dependent receptor n=1 Tax=Phenylobacterium sp. TaxID=1871053 RepID=UPI001A553A3C|nr:TonB-dependent receptor [Phenylobacterium sp.]MBL8773303.1 TonB-dependent receptor [Phenylobacterium sp.]